MMSTEDQVPRRQQWWSLAGIFAVAVFASVLGAVVSAGYLAQIIQRDFLTHWGLREADRARHSENMLYALHGLELKKLAEKRDYDAILTKSCWLLLVAIPKLTPEIWGDSPRGEQDERYAADAHRAVSELIETGHCPPDAKAKLEGSTE